MLFEAAQSGNRARELRLRRLCFAMNRIHVHAAVWSTKARRVTRSGYTRIPAAALNKMQVRSNLLGPLRNLRALTLHSNNVRARHTMTVTSTTPTAPDLAHPSAMRLNSTEVN